MKIVNRAKWLLVLGVLLIGHGPVQAEELAAPAKETDQAETDSSQAQTDQAEVDAEQSEAPDIFQAIDDGLIDVKFVARSASEGRLVMTNKTSEPVEVQIPEAFAGVPVLRQFGGGGGGGLGGGGGGLGGGGGGSQSVGGGGGGRGGGGRGGGQFNIPPEKIERVDVPLLCLEHGLKDPSSSKPYEIRPLEDVVDSPAVVEIVKAFASGSLPRGASQAAVWHVNSGVSWIDLANKLTGTKRQVVRNPYFSPAEIRVAMAIVYQAETMTEGEQLKRRNWKPPTEKDESDQPAYDGYTPEFEDSPAEGEAEVTAGEQ